MILALAGRERSLRSATGRKGVWIPHAFVILSEAENLCSLLAPAKYRGPSLAQDDKAILIAKSFLMAKRSWMAKLF
jgi:hypothetical protein